jgi:hypothetical protein
MFLIFVCRCKSGKSSLKISNIELGYPVPGIPYYHFKAELELAEPSIIELEATVNGKASAACGSISWRQ